MPITLHTSKVGSQVQRDETVGATYIDVWPLLQEVLPCGGVMDSMEGLGMLAPMMCDFDRRYKDILLDSIAADPHYCSQQACLCLILNNTQWSKYRSLLNIFHKVQCKRFILHVLLQNIIRC